MPPPITFPKAQFVKKGWGSELIFANNNHYCGKLLRFEPGQQFSLHFHYNKDETWFVLEGNFLLTYFNLQTAEEIRRVLGVGDTIHVPPGNPHRLYASDKASIVEVSTRHDDEDSYRIGKGASQC